MGRFNNFEKYLGFKDVLTLTWFTLSLQESWFKIEVDKTILKLKRSRYQLNLEYRLNM